MYRGIQMLENVSSILVAKQNNFANRFHYLILWKFKLVDIKMFKVICSILFEFTCDIDLSIIFIPRVNAIFSAVLCCAVIMDNFDQTLLFLKKYQCMSPVNFCLKSRIQKITIVKYNAVSKFKYFKFLKERFRVGFTLRKCYDSHNVFFCKTDIVFVTERSFGVQTWESYKICDSKMAR